MSARSPGVGVSVPSQVPERPPVPWPDDEETIERLETETPVRCSTHRDRRGERIEELASRWPVHQRDGEEARG